MERFFSEALNVPPETFSFIILPILVFLARICDVSISTLRIIFVLNSRKGTATILGFFESLIWLVAIGQIFQHINNPVTYIAYAGGFATGTLVGMLLEERLALGRVVVRIMTQKPATKLVDYLQTHNFRYSTVKAESEEGIVDVVFTVLKRDRLPELLAVIESFNPKAFYTIEGVKKVSQEDAVVSGRLRQRWKQALKIR
ncbi:DUF2179 domain-containing protein [Roseivirga sp. BDSF3-8]|uniref:DUF2179 domain-containing protein n=1 Tax=Roseivirga sp. BDSF3-8 TaxID=3241598 RepID=UPI00353185ED